jgi:hypothetical protein
MERRVLSVRDGHIFVCGARKITRRLQDKGIKPPALSTAFDPAITWSSDAALREASSQW